MKTNVILIAVLIISILAAIYFFTKKKKPASTTTTANTGGNTNANANANTNTGTSTSTTTNTTGNNLTLPVEQPNVRPLTKDEIKVWQAFLLDKGYNLGNTGLARNGVDGVWGEYTTAATRDWTGKSLLNYEEMQFWLRKDLRDNLPADARISNVLEKVKSLAQTMDSKTPQESSPTIKIVNPIIEPTPQYTVDSALIKPLRGTEVKKIVLA